MRKLLFTLHLVAGTAAGLLLAVIGLTGSLLVFRHEIEAALEPGLLRVEPRGRRAPLPTVAEAAGGVAPEAPIQHIFVAATPDGVHEVWLQGTERRIYVDPYTAAVVGVRDADRSVTGWLFALHTKLLSGENGERVVGYGGFVLLFLSLSGIVLWWPSHLKQARDRLRIKWGASGKRVNYDLHRSGGFYVAGLLALSALTGVSLVFSEGAASAAYRLTGASQPPKPTVTAPVAAKPLPLGELLRRADKALPGGELRRVTFPAKPGAPLLIRKRSEDELHPNGMNHIYLDPYRGDVLRVDTSAGAAAGQRLLNLRYPLHIGHWGGMLTRILYAGLGLTPSILFVTGCLMWWNRVGAKRRRRVTARALRPVSESRASREAASACAHEAEPFVRPGTP